MDSAYDVGWLGRKSGVFEVNTRGRCAFNDPASGLRQCKLLDLTDQAAGDVAKAKRTPFIPLQLAFRSYRVFRIGNARSTWIGAKICGFHRAIHITPKCGRANTFQEYSKNSRVGCL